MTAEMANTMPTADANAPATALAQHTPLRMSDIGRRLLWLVPAIIILSGFIRAQAEVAPCPSGIDERAIDEWLSGTVTKRHTSPKYDGATRISAKSVCNVKHWVVGQVKNDYDDVVDYQGRYSVFPPDNDTPFTGQDVAAGLPWEIKLADGRVLYPIEPLYWVGSYAHRKWAVLKEPDARPANVPSGAVWVGGLGRKEAYVMCKITESGYYEVHLYYFFRGNKSALTTSGPLIYEIKPGASRIYADTTPIFIDDYDRLLLMDGRMLARKK